MSSNLVIQGLIASMDVKFERLDVKTTFLQGNLREDNLVQLEVFKEKGRSTWFVDIRRVYIG